VRLSHLEKGHNSIEMFKRIRFQAASLVWRPNPAGVLLVVWGLFIIYGTLLPFDLSEPADSVHERMRRLWEQPWRPSSRTDLFSNVLLFMPWGFLIAMWANGRGIHALTTLFVAIFSAALLSGSVEFLQLYAPTRTTSFVDLTTNTTGSVVGALIGWPCARWLWPRLSIKLRRMIAAYPLAGCALATAMGLLFAGLSPFDVSLDVGDIKAAIVRSRLLPFGPPLRGPAPESKPWSWAGELLSWTLAGGLFALTARESRRRGLVAIGWSVLFAGGVSLAIETIQIAIPSHEVDMTSVVLALLGSAAGAFVVERSAIGAARQWIIPALLVWAGTVALSAWTPPHFAWPEPPFVRPERFLPFWSYYISSRLTDLAGLFGQLLAFVPLGVLLAARSRRQSTLGAALIGLGGGFVFEFGQIFLPARTAELTSVLMAAGGAGLGVALWRWGESLHYSSQGAARYRIGPQAGRRD
jgi:glycopeptide antibiotics resistance protein